MRFAPEFRHHQIAHLVAAVVKLGFCRLTPHRRPKRNEKHTTLGAKFLVGSARMPPFAEALRRKNDPSPAREPQRVAAGFLARAHERRHSCPARPDARSPCHRRAPFFATLGPLARTAKRFQDRKIQERRIANHPSEFGKAVSTLDRDHVEIRPRVIKPSQSNAHLISSPAMRLPDLHPILRNDELVRMMLSRRTHPFSCYHDALSSLHPSVDE